MDDPSEPIHSDDITDLAEALAPRLHSPSHAKRAAFVVKAGRLALSANTVAWICSISIHAVVFGAGVWIVTTLIHHAHLPSEWGGGGGSSGGLLAGEMRSHVADGMPAAASPAPLQAIPRQFPAEDASDAAFSSERRTSIDLPDDTDAAPIGASATSDAGQPHFNSRRPQPAGNGSFSGKSSDSPAASSTGSTGDSGPGLPGSLLGNGPPAPDYPPESKRLGEQGTVRVAIEVLTDGTVGEIQVLSDPGFVRLRDASIKAAQLLRKYKLNPAIRGGKPIREVIVIPYNFRLH